MAQEAGVDIDTITKWSTRASQAQTRTYMHQDPERCATKVAEKQGLIPKPKYAPITDSEYQLIDKGPVIVTRYGVCSHDYAFTPCNKHADCLNCSELLMCKGHKKSLVAIIQERDRTAVNLKAAKDKIDANEYVATRWYESHLRNFKRLDNLVKVMTDPSIQNGSTIQMNGTDFSHEKRITKSLATTEDYSIIDKKSLELKYSDDLLDCLRMLNEEDDA